MMPTFGAGVKFGVYRVIGTILGATWGVVAWMASSDNHAGLFFLMLIFILPMQYIVHNTQYPRVGVIAITTLAVVLLGKNTDAIFDIPSDPVYVLAYKRALWVTLGVIAVFIASRAAWPYLARKELRKGLSETIVGIFDKHIYMSLKSRYCSSVCQTNGKFCRRKDGRTTVA
jgi:hypothetical protein